MKRDRQSLPHTGLPLRIVLVYALFGALWIIISDLLVAKLVPEPFIETFSIVKGWFFIAVTALLLYLLISRQNETLAESQQRLGFALDGSNDGLWDVQLDTGSVYLSPRACEILGYQAQDMAQIAKIWNDLVHPDDLPATQAALSSYLEGREPLFSVEQRLKTASGEWKWILARGKVVSRDSQGAPVRMAGTHTDITERRRMEKSLHEQKKFTEKLIESSSTATFVLDPQHKVVLWNKACEELTGISAAAMVGTGNHWQAFYDHERPCLSDVVLDAGFTRLPDLYAVYAKSTLVPDGLHAEGWYPDLNGSDRYIMFDAAPVYDGNGVVLAAIETLQDITDKKQVDVALRESTERMAVILDGINALIYVADLETHELLFVNKYGRDIWGEIAGKICWETLQEGQGGPCAFCTNDRLLTADGAPTGVYAWEFQNTITGCWYDCRDQAIRWSDGRLVRMEIATDITDRKKAEEAQHLQSAALQAAANSIVITDRNGSIAWVNPAFTTLTGYSAEEAIGKNLRDLVKSGVHDQAFYKQLWDALLAGEVWRGEIMNRHKNGTLYPEGQTITPVKDASGDITHFVAIKRDLTEHHKLEAQLIQAQKMESIGTLAGGVAHDFNNILTAIIGYGYLVLRKMAQDDPQRLTIEHMLEAADRAAHLTKDLLLFSRKQAIDRKPVDLNMVVEKVEKFLKRVIGEDIECNTMLQEVKLPVLADAYQLEQVLMNFATNARDAMPQGGALTVTTESFQLNEDFTTEHGFGKPGRYALLTVSDTGAGMDEGTRQRIFEPFFTTKEVGKGTGLGLAVVYGIIKQHEGLITVDSESGSGTTFRIYLPIFAEKTGEETRNLQEEDSVGGTETILLAEDDEAVRNLTKAVLTEFGYTVILAIDGEDAVKNFMANKDAIDLLLFDLIMPKKTGKEAYDEIRKIRPEIPAIFTSGYAPDVIRRKAAVERDVMIVTKPAPPAELLIKVRTILDDKR
jgi:two-component system NtrC family sensor kinase